MREEGQTPMQERTSGPRAQEVEYVFVYGTLRPPREGQDPRDSMYHPAVAHQVLWSVSAWLDGAELYDFGDYPGAYPGQGRIQGDLLAVEPQALRTMDRIELEGHEYRRRRVTVHTERGPQEAWIYWAPEDWRPLGRRIPSGDWFRRGTGHGGEDDGR